MTNTPATTNWHAESRWGLLLRLLLFGVPLLVLAAWYGRSAGQDWLEFEKWIARIGIWGPLVLIAVTVVVSLFLFPDTPFAMAAGALFGLAWGSIYAVIGILLGTSLTFWVSRLLFRKRVHHYLSSHPRWAALESACSREGLRLQLLIRLTPVHSALFSYIMGASRLRYDAFAIGCLAMIPGIIVEVYCGHVAGHVAGLASGTSKHTLPETIATVCGLLFAVIAMAYVARIARRAVAESEAKIDLSTHGDLSVNPTLPMP